VWLPIDLVTYYDNLGAAAYPWAVALPVAAVSLDFCGVPVSVVWSRRMGVVGCCVMLRHVACHNPAVTHGSRLHHHRPTNTAQTNKRQGSSGGNASLALIRQHGFPAAKRLGAGLIDGRSPYADDLAAVASVLAELRGPLGLSNISVQPSTTLQVCVCVALWVWCGVVGRACITAAVASKLCHS
jgi:5-methyltetrahydropteroyltriglutamate--homocysteine methyltransferase